MKKIVEIGAITLIIVLSGSVYYGQYSSILRNFLCGLCLVIYIINGLSINKKNLYRFILISIAILSTLIASLKYEPIINDVIRLILEIGIIMLFQSNISKMKFSNYYINIMVIISIVSLISFFLVQLGVNPLPLQSKIEAGTSLYEATPYFVLGRYNYHKDILFSNRNCGIFWEPGAYQAFINIALILILSKFKNDKVERINIIKVIILIITLISTGSTTGYIVGAIIGIFHIINIKFKINLKYFKKISTLIFAFIIIVALVPKDNVIYNKLIQKNDSYSTRKGDIINSYKIGNKEPLFGYGYFSKEYLKQEYENDIFENSNGLGMLYAMMGIFVFFMYIFCTYKGLKDTFEVKGNYAIAILIIFIIFHSTEYFVFKYFFITFLFNWGMTNTELPVVGKEN